MTRQPHRLCYLITSARGFLVDLWEGTATWEAAPHRAIENHLCWLDVAVARKKMKELQRQLPELVVSLTLLEFVKEETSWVPVAQRALGGEVVK
jgi:hypothetical protein